MADGSENVTKTAMQMRMGVGKTQQLQQLIMGFPKAGKLRAKKVLLKGIKKVNIFSNRCVIIQYHAWACTGKY